MHLPGGIMAYGYPYRVVMGFGLCALGGVMLLTYFRTSSKEAPKSRTNCKRGKQKQLHGTTSKKSLNGEMVSCASGNTSEISIEFVVPNDHIPLMAGRGGSNLKSIEDRTHTNIQFRDKDDQNQWCEIVGLPDQVYEAEQLLLKEAERVPNVSEELYVAQSVYGEIAGRCGEAMQEICRISLAKIAVDVGVQGGQMRRIIISGNRQQVNKARKLIEDKIEEDRILKRDLAEAEQKREPRRSITNSLSSSQNSLNLLPPTMPTREKLQVEDELDGQVESVEGHELKINMKVYVSAVESPSKFWVQLLGTQIKKLDDLVCSMTEYYSKAENRELHQIQVPYLGQIVATILKSDNKWYRAEVARILPNQYNPNEVVLDLYFVDYGDREYMLPKEIFELRTDFLTLRFQAIECFLANVHPNAESDEVDVWDTQAISYFEELVQAARWKQLTARVLTYKDRFKVTTNGDNTSSRESSPIPGVELFDSHIETSLNDLMIANGYALPLTAMNKNHDRVSLS